MSTKIRPLLVTSILLAICSHQSLAEVSTNLGVVSQYHFRGIQQTTGASTSAGVDYEKDNFSLGAWTADVDDGLEIDLYGRYGIELDGGINLGFGATSYQYTGDFDSAYNEINLSASYNNFSLGYNIGKWDGVVGNEAATENDYTILTLGFEYNGFSGDLGFYGDEAEGEYFDLSYGTTIGEFDVSVGLVVSGSDLDDDESLYLSFGKTFDLN